LPPGGAEAFRGDGPGTEELFLPGGGYFPKPDFHAAWHFDHSIVFILGGHHDHEGFVSWCPVFVDTSGAASQSNLPEGKGRRCGGSRTGGMRARCLAGVRLVEMAGLFQGATGFCQFALALA
jgi:hypothetical protein